MAANESASVLSSSIAQVTGPVLASNITQLVEHPGIFLQSNSAKVIAGAFTWMALFITGHQVRERDDDCITGTAITAADS